MFKTILRKIFYSLPPSLRFAARRGYYFPLDVWALLSGTRHPLTPPRGLVYTGSGDFQAQADKMLRFFVTKAGLQTDHAVLDIGSGIGRMAIPLTRYLDRNGTYQGFDVVKLGVRWCQRHISKGFPNFQFQYIPLKNDLYRADGEDAAQFSFPYPAATFDFAIVISVFTHLLPAQVENYLCEIVRTLKPGGICVATFFVLNEDAKERMPSNPAFSFPYDQGHYRLMDQKVQSANVAFEASYLEEQLQRAGLSVQQQYPGYWCGRAKAECEDFQDILVLQKRSVFFNVNDG